jgi:hypothetical protein
MQRVPIFIIFAASISLLSCNSFETQFYKNVDSGQTSNIENKQPHIFDLASITDFQWDSVFYVAGNESVPIFADEIEEDLKRKTTDLSTYKDRFYFLQSNKNLVVKEISSGIFSHKPAFYITRCKLDSLNCRSWLSRAECIFTLGYNSDTIGNGTVTLVPKCIPMLNSKRIEFCGN